MLPGNFTEVATDDPAFVEGLEPPGDSKKPVVLLLAVIVVLGLGAAGWKVLRPSGDVWLHELGDGFDEAAVSGKPVLAFFTADWCPPCRRIKQDVLSDPAIEAMLAENFVRVKVDLSDRQGPNNWVASDANVRIIPSMILYDEDGYELQRMIGGGPIENFIYTEYNMR